MFDDTSGGAGFVGCASCWLEVGAGTTIVGTRAGLGVSVGGTGVIVGETTSCALVGGEVGVGGRGISVGWSVGGGIAGWTGVSIGGTSVSVAGRAPGAETGAGADGFGVGTGCAVHAPAKTAIAATIDNGRPIRFINLATGKCH